MLGQKSGVAAIAMLEGAKIIVGDLAAFDWTYCDVPFSDRIVNFCADLSRSILTDPRCRDYPDLMTFGFFCRKANVLRMQASYAVDGLRLGRGIVFHVAPANIPVNYLFSFIFSFLSGNGNILRLPSRRFPQVELANALVAQLLDRPDYAALTRATLFLESERDALCLDEFVRRADGLMVWGGDQTVEHFRAKPRKPRSVELSFFDRYSACVFDAQAILGITAEEREKLCQQFFNDSFLVDQNACSSPRLVFWRGAPLLVEQAQAQFWSAMANYTERRYELNGVNVVDKMIETVKAVQAYPDARLKRSGNYIYRLSLPHIDADITRIEARFGLFLEAADETLDPFYAAISEKYQTITTYGVAPAAIAEGVRRCCVKGIDRIVPVGAALEVNVLWDGHDIVRSLSRIVAC